MKQLLIDAGNSRLKWATLRAGRVGRVWAMGWTSASAGRVARRVMAANSEVARIMVCSVAGAVLERELRRAARGANLVAPLFIRSTRRAAGVRNGYQDTWRLGADRWVALIGARALAPQRALCVVDIGTAMTIDLLDAAGRHRGGLIVPGPALMVESLLAGTAGIRRRARQTLPRRRHGRAGSVFGRSTRAGLLAGSELAAAALIERSMLEARSLLGSRPRLLVAGGGIAAVTARLTMSVVRIDDLVLHGLGVLAAGESG